MKELHARQVEIVAVEAPNMPTGAFPSNDFPEGGSPVVSGPVELPGWLKARRDRQSSEAPAGTPSSMGVQPAVPAQAPEQPATLESTLANLEVAPVSKRKKVRRKTIGVPAFIKQNWLVISARTWLSQWISKQTAMSVSISFGLHMLILLSLAFIVISHAKAPDVISIWGGDGEVGDGGGFGGDMLIDMGAPGEAGEAAPLMDEQFAQNLDALSGAASPQEANRVMTGGKGKGEGESGTGMGGGGGGSGGNGVGFGVGGIKVPGHAQTKGSFTAWADPRDPKPGQDYFIVITIQLPKNIKKYRASDLKGTVKGTDNYEQKIPPDATQQFAVENGGVAIRIRVPGAARMVRDTIKIESKLLKEKQEFEIEF